MITKSQINSWLRSTFGLVILLNFIGCSTVAEIDPSVQIEKKAHIVQRVQPPTTENETESSRFKVGFCSLDNEQRNVYDAKFILEMSN